MGKNKLPLPLGEGWGEGQTHPMPKPNNPRYIVGLARQLRQRQTPTEEILWARLRNRKLGGAKFRRQHPLGRYVPDFYCHEASLAVELEGRIHDQAHQREYDAVRRETIEQLGVRILVFKNEQVTEDLEGVLAQILRAIMSQQKETKS